MSRPDAMVLAFALLVAFAGDAHAQIPSTFTNLQVMPKDVSRAALVAGMRDFSIGLGVRCNYCHVGENAETLEKFDFAADAKPTKAIARVMIRMTREINDRLLADIGRPRTVSVTCLTCHRGLQVPTT